MATQKFTEALQNELSGAYSGFVILHSVCLLTFFGFPQTFRDPFGVLQRNQVRFHESFRDSAHASNEQ